MAKKRPPFEESLTRLEAIVKTLEQGELSLNDSLKLFEEGTTLISALNAELDQAEQKVCILKKNVDGTPVTDCVYED